MVKFGGIWEPLTQIAARILHWLSGPSVVVLDDSVGNHVASLTAYSVFGYDVTIQCHATYFKRVFKRFYIPNRRMAVYSINTVVPPNAPCSLQQVAGSFSANVPRECAFFLREVYQKQRAIEAYLDLLLAQVERKQAERFS
jgi:hypothetical protein